MKYTIKHNVKQCAIKTNNVSKRISLTTKYENNIYENVINNTMHENKRDREVLSWTCITY